MTGAGWERILGFQRAFEEPFTVRATIAVAVAIVLSGVLIQALRRLNKVSEARYDDLWSRWKSWIWLTLGILLPILAGIVWTILAVALLSLACYREFARAVGLFREKSVSVVVVLGILLVTFANLDHYDRLFFAAAPLTVSLLAVVTIPLDSPKGYVQRTALGVFGFLLFGHSLGYLGAIANSGNYRPVLLLIFIGVELNDIFAYCVGNLLKGPKLLKVTSPGKTVAGSVGALALTTPLVAVLAHFIFQGTSLDRPHLLLALGLIVSCLGQLGDLVLSSIKRDIGIKDIGSVLPGHGGLLDRFNSMLLVPPAVYHFLSVNLGPWGADQPTRIFTGG